MFKSVIFSSVFLIVDVDFFTALLRLDFQKNCDDINVATEFTTNSLILMAIILAFYFLLFVAVSLQAFCCCQTVFILHHAFANSFVHLFIFYFLFHQRTETSLVNSFIVRKGNKFLI